MNKKKAALYRNDGYIIRSYPSLWKMAKDLDLPYSIVYTYAKTGDYLRGGIGFIRIFEDKPALFVEPKKVEQMVKHRKLPKKKQPTAKQVVSPVQLKVTDEMILNTRLIKNHIETLRTELEDIGGSRFKRLMNIVILLHQESVMLGVVSERNGKGKELEDKICESRRKS